MKKILIITILMTACTTTAPTEPTVTEVTDEPNPSSIAEEIPKAPAEKAISPPPQKTSLTSLSSDLSDWIAAWQQFNPEFSLSQMNKMRSNTIQPDISEPLELHEYLLDMQEEYPYSILFPSPDLMTVAYVSPSGSPDSEVAILKPEENLYERVLFCGTPCNFDGAMWIDNDRFVVTGYSEIHSNQRNGCIADQPCTVVPTLHIFDVVNGTVIEYAGPEVNAAAFFSH